ncbi:unnamed protein product [Arctia plantaginis]|uniref:BZIP domain-containing protein n=2 Tax=Obtectomera TaxID=104431 RepID=A0A8S1BGJ6_ARCPL|nr:unnamed protein product [Arctia plantaginis]
MSRNDFLSHGASFNKKYGKSVNNKDPLEDKKDDSDLWEAQAAFLGPTLWDKTLPYDPDLKYADLDEFLSENGMSGEGLGGAHLGGSAFGPALGLQAPVTKRERSPSPSDCMSPDTINPPLSPADSTFSMASSGRDFDPRTRAFSDEELKPQPMIKKSRKQVNDFVPDDLKDDKYWARRRKNNMAAKRSRDARRMKENQIAMRAGYLEKENMGLRQEAARSLHSPTPSRIAQTRQTTCRGRTVSARNLGRVAGIGHNPPSSRVEPSYLPHEPRRALSGACDGHHLVPPGAARPQRAHAALHRRCRRYFESLLPDPSTSVASVQP